MSVAAEKDWKAEWACCGGPHTVADVEANSPGYGHSISCPNRERTPTEQARGEIQFVLALGGVSLTARQHLRRALDLLTP